MHAHDASVVADTRKGPVCAFGGNRSALHSDAVNVAYVDICWNGKRKLLLFSEPHLSHECVLACCTGFESYSTARQASQGVPQT